MTPRELVDLQLDAIFGATMPSKVQALVDAELNAGRWHDGYDIAVNASGLNQSEGQKLLDIVLGQHPGLKIDQEKLLASIDQNLPQSTFAKVLWLAADDGTFVVTDSLRVARYRMESPIWITPRISFDGIELVSADADVVRGLAFLGSSNYPDSPFTLDFESGSIREGSVIEY
ncbi:MAG: hypothetical protein AAF357_00145 [Verrucomicrobiota bacterium]